MFSSLCLDLLITNLATRPLTLVFIQCLKWELSLCSLVKLSVFKDLWPAVVYVRMRGKSKRMKKKVSFAVFFSTNLTHKMCLSVKLRFEISMDSLDLKVF